MGEPLQYRHGRDDGLPFLLGAAVLQLAGEPFTPGLPALLDPS